MCDKRYARVIFTVESPQTGTVRLETSRWPDFHPPWWKRVYWRVRWFFTA